MVKFNFSLSKPGKQTFLVKI